MFPALKVKEGFTPTEEEKQFFPFLVNDPYDNRNDNPPGHFGGRGYEMQVMPPSSTPPSPQIYMPRRTPPEQIVKKDISFNEMRQILLDESRRYMKNLEADFFNEEKFLEIQLEDARNSRERNMIKQEMENLIDEFRESQQNRGELLEKDMDKLRILFLEKERAEKREREAERSREAAKRLEEERKKEERERRMQEMKQAAIEEQKREEQKKKNIQAWKLSDCLGKEGFSKLNLWSEDFNSSNSKQYDNYEGPNIKYPQEMNYKEMIKDSEEELMEKFNTVREIRKLEKKRLNPNKESMVVVNY